MKHSIHCALAAALLTAVFSLHCAGTFAADGKDHIGARTEHLATLLDLSKDQQAAIRTGMTEHKDRIRAIRLEYEPVFSEMKTALKQVRLEEGDSFEESRSKASAIRKQYAQKLQPMKEELKEERERFQESLSDLLSEIQWEKYQALKSLRAVHGEKCGTSGDVHRKLKSRRLLKYPER